MLDFSTPNNTYIYHQFYFQEHWNNVSQNMVISYRWWNSWNYFDSFFETRNWKRQNNIIVNSWIKNNFHWISYGAFMHYDKYSVISLNEIGWVFIFCFVGDVTSYLKLFSLLLICAFLRIMDKKRDFLLIIVFLFVFEIFFWNLITYSKACEIAISCSLMVRNAGRSSGFAAQLNRMIWNMIKRK